jgi:hypothetical protein
MFLKFCAGAGRTERRAGSACKCQRGADSRPYTGGQHNAQRARRASNSVIVNEEDKDFLTLFPKVFLRRRLFAASQAEEEEREREREIGRMETAALRRELASREQQCIDLAAALDRKMEVMNSFLTWFDCAQHQKKKKGVSSQRGSEAGRVHDAAQARG